MASYAFRIVNVFAETLLGGNPLCVFEDARGLDTATMQALALQFNLSETTFLLPSDVASAHVRIFTPTFEMPFAGHPTLGTAHVLRELRQSGNAVTLQMQAGIIPVGAQGDRWELRAGTPGALPISRKAAPVADLAAMLGLETRDIAGEALWIDTGSEQLVIPLADAAAVARAAPNIEGLIAHGSNGKRQGLAYVWAPVGEGRVVSRFFFNKQNAVTEDPGTGSAAANLGGWHLVTRSELPLQVAIDQGAQTGRPCAVGLRVTPGREIYVSGRVVELARGTVTL